MDGLQDLLLSLACGGAFWLQHMDVGERKKGSEWLSKVVGEGSKVERGSSL